MMHFPLFQISPSVSEKNFRLRGKLSNFYLFTKKFLMTFLVIDCEFSISPIFAISIHYFHPISRKLLFPPVKFTFFTYFMCFSFPPSLTMMNLCITQCTYWTPLLIILSSCLPLFDLYFS